MSDVEVPFGDSARNTAILLLEAAQRLGLEKSVVRTSQKGVFYVPEEVEKVAFSKEQAPVKKTAAKKTAAKKTASKKTASKNKE